MMAWQAVLERLSKMDRLKKIGVLQNQTYKCVFCNMEEESNNHIFLHCNFVWSVWGEHLKWFGLSLAIPKDLKSMIDI